MIASSVALFVCVSGRMVTAQALTSAVPAPADRGAFMAINSALQQVSGGFAAMIGGQLISLRADGGLEHFDRIGFAVAAATLVTLYPMSLIARSVQSAPPPTPPPQA